MAPAYTLGDAGAFFYELRSLASAINLQELVMEQVWFTAASWLGVALLASLISIRTGISVALVEIFLGVMAGNFLGFHSAPWIDVLAAFGSMMLTFLAGAEIDPVSFRKHLKPSLVIGSAVVPTFIAQTWFQPKTVVPYEPAYFGSPEHVLHMPEEYEV
jgi:Kef-type K+ transport system membrane component KefB